MTAAIKQCTCTHEFQDKTYGKGKRVMNQTYKSVGAKEYRCSVCGTTTKSFK